MKVAKKILKHLHSIKDYMLTNLWSNNCDVGYNDVDYVGTQMIGDPLLDIFLWWKEEVFHGEMQKKIFPTSSKIEA